MQNTANRKGYLAFSLKLTTAAARLVDLYAAQINPNAPLAGSYREVHIEIDPETSSGLSVRIGDGSLGTTVNTVLQKGKTLSGAGVVAQTYVTYRGSGQNGVPVLMMSLQAVSGTPIVDIELLEL